MASAVRSSSLLHSPSLLRLRPSSQTSQLSHTLRRTSRVQASRISTTAEGSAPRQSVLRSSLALAGRGILFTALGFAMTVAPVHESVAAIAAPPTSAESLKLYQPTDDHTQAIEDHINSHHVVAHLRSRAAAGELTESRPHLKIPAPHRAHSLTGGTLIGHGRVAVPPFDWTAPDGKTYAQVAHLGDDLCGHPGIVHGGFLATMLDEGLARCCFPALPHNIGMTANLNINYRSPAPAGSFVVLHATTTKVEGRKAWVEGRIETLVPEGETPVVLAEATALFISPRQAATMKKFYPVN